MSDKIKKLRAKRDDIAKKMRNNAAADTGDFNAQLHADLSAQIEQIDAQIAALQSVMDDEARDVFNRDNPDPDTGRAPGRAPEVQDDARTQVFGAWLRGGDRAVDTLPESVRNDYQREVRAALSTGTDATGGALVPTTFAGELLQAMTAFGGARAVADVMQTESGEVMQWPTVDETTEEGEWLDENVAATDGDPSFGTVSIGAHRLSSRVIAIPLAILQDTNLPNLVGMVQAMQAARLGRSGNKAYTNGNGTGKPAGMVGAAAVGHTTAVGMDTGYAYNDLIEIEHSVDPIYRRNSLFMVHDSGLKAIKKLKDSQGRPLWLPGISGATPAEILGYGYELNQDLAAPAAGATSIMFGDFKKYKIRDVASVVFHRFTDSAYAKKGQVGFLAVVRTDGRLIAADDQAFKKLVHGAAA